MSNTGNKPQLQLLHKGLILVLVPLAIELAFIATMWQLLMHADVETRRLSHAKEVSADLNQLDQAIIEVGKLGALFSITHDERLLARISDAFHRVGRTVIEIELITNESPEEHAAFLKLKPSIEDIRSLIEPVVKEVDRGGTFSIFSEREKVRSLATMAGKLKENAQELLDIENRVEAAGAVEAANARRMVLNGIAIGVLINILIAAALAIFFYRELLQRLRILMENTDRLASGKQLLPRISGGDEIEHLDQVFHNMADALAESAAYKSQLIGMVSHDLRSPLTSIQASLALLDVGAMGELPEAAKAEVQVAERNTTRLISLINDLLDIERIEAGRLEIKAQPTSSNEVIATALEAINALASEFSIQIQTPQAGFELIGDHDRLVQVLVNFLTNAIKFSPQSSVVSVEVSDSPTYKEFRVTDQGPGIESSQLTSLFQRFHHRAADSARLKSTGLGLSISKAIIQSHNGEIGVDSEPGKGASFWFRIPTSVSLVSEVKQKLS